MSALYLQFSIVNKKGAIIFLRSMTYVNSSHNELCNYCSTRGSRFIKSGNQTANGNLEDLATIYESLKNIFPSSTYLFY